MGDMDKVIAGPGFTGTVHPDGDRVFELRAGTRELLRFGRVRCGGFAESGALVKKLRGHGSLDALSASIDMESIVPFGCEYRIGRELEMVSGLGLWTVDVSAVTRGIVSAVELEPVVFPGPWAKMEYLVYGEREFRCVVPGGEEREFVRGRELVMSVRLTAPDGVRVEFNAGGDLWRHRAAAYLPEVEGEYALTGSSKEVVLTRKVFVFPAEAVIEKRPWRFRNSFAWSLPGDEPGCPGEDSDSEAVLDYAALELPESGRRIECGGGSTHFPCLTSPAARRIFRDFVRRAGSNVRVAGLAPGVCGAAAHLERPGRRELEHLDLDDCISFYLWGNRRLAEKGFRLRIAPFSEGPFAGSVCAANLGHYPRVPVEEWREK